MIEPVLELQGERAPEGVQPVGGVGARAELHSIDGELREQVELHGVAERLVDADAVLVDGDALGQADHRRGAEAAEAERRLKGIRGRAFEGDRAQTLVQGVGHRGRPARRQIAPVDHRDGRGHAVPVDPRAGEGGDRHHVHLLRYPADGQRHVEHPRAPRRQTHILRLLRLEPAHREGHGVGARRQDQGILAGVVADGGGRRRRRRRAGGDRNAGQDGALRVGDPPGELRRLGRGGRRAHGAQEDGPGEGEEADDDCGAASPPRVTSGSHRSVSLPSRSLAPRAACSARRSGR